MEIERDSRNSSFKELVSIDQIAIEQILYKEVRGRQDRVGLEDQPTELCRAFGRLLNVLLDKKIIDLDKLHEILDSDWVLRKDATLKEENPT